MESDVTHLIYQFPCFGSNDVASLRETLERNCRVYFEGFEHGFNAMYPRSVGNLVGPDYERLHQRMIEAIDQRNKIFHGQLTPRYLSTDDLVDYVLDIRAWCETLSRNTPLEFGYDGFGRNSFQKSAITDLWKRFNLDLADVRSYGKFIKHHMQRS